MCQIKIFNSIRKKLRYNKLSFILSILFSFSGIAIIIAAIIINSDVNHLDRDNWLILGLTVGLLLIFFGVMCFTIFWNFGKVRDPRNIKDLPANVGSGRGVPKEIENKLEEVKETEKRRTMQRERQQQQENLERQTTIQSTRTENTEMPGSRVVSYDSAEAVGRNGQNRSFEPFPQTIQEETYMSFDNRSFNRE